MPKISSSRIRRILLRIVLGSIVVFFLIILIAIAPALWNRWIVYPKLDQERDLLAGSHQELVSKIPLTDFKGVLHSHSYWSHDSRGVLSEILPAAKDADLDFIFLSDHKRAPLDTFPRGYHGIYEGILIEAGTESNGMMVSPLQRTIIDWSHKTEKIILEIAEQGGMVFYVHSEETHDWGNPDYHGMEIYNLHTDLKDESGLLPFLLNSVLTGKQYKHWAYRELYDDQDQIWALWDSLNQHRRIVGIAAVDAHNNQSIRARYLEDGRVEWVGSNAKTIAMVEPGWKESLLLGKPDTAGWAWKWELDTYFHSFNYVNTHILADSLTVGNLRKHLLAGHAFIAFESLANADGFQFFTEGINGQMNAIMGDSIPVGKVRQLKALSPIPARFELVKDGGLVDQQTKPAYEYRIEPSEEIGNYRLAARVLLGKRWVLWVMTNPIYLY